jgi:hypothetical protein
MSENSNFWSKTENISYFSNLAIANAIAYYIENAFGVPCFSAVFVGTGKVNSFQK